MRKSEIISMLIKLSTSGYFFGAKYIRRKIVESTKHENKMIIIIKDTNDELWASGFAAWFLNNIPYSNIKSGARFCFELN